MERDLKFEVQFLLSLTLVVFGLLSIETFNESINPWIGYFVILLLSIHFSIFNLSYGIGQGIPYSIDFLDSLRRWSRPVLFAISMAFAYFIGHTLHALGADHVISNFSSVPLGWEILIEYVSPIFYIGVMVVAFKNNVQDTIEEMEDINIKIIPHSIRIYPSSDETKRLTVKIENLGEASFEYGLDINIPPEVFLELDGEPIEDSYNSTGEVAPDRAKRMSFGLFHEADQRATDIISVSMDFEGGSKTQEVEVDLVV